MDSAVIGLVGVAVGGVIGFFGSYLTARMNLDAQAVENDKILNAQRVENDHALEAQRAENRKARQHAAYAEVLEAFHSAVEKAAQFASVSISTGYPQENTAQTELAERMRREWAEYSLAAWQARSKFRVSYMNARLVAGTEFARHVEALDDFLESNVYRFQPFVHYRRKVEMPISPIAPSGLDAAAAEISDSFIKALTDQL